MSSLEKLSTIDFDSLISEINNQPSNNIKKKNKEFESLKQFYSQFNIDEIDFNHTNDSPVKNFIQNLNEHNFLFDRELFEKKIAERISLNKHKNKISSSDFIFYIFPSSILVFYQSYFLSNSQDILSLLNSSFLTVIFFLVMLSILSIIKTYEAKKYEKNFISWLKQEGIINLSIGEYIYHKFKSNNDDFNNFFATKMIEPKYKGKIYYESGLNILHSEDTQKSIVAKIIIDYFNNKNQKIVN